MEMFQRQQLQLKFHSLIQTKLKSAILNNWKEKKIIHDQKMEVGSNKEVQPAGIKRGGKIQKLNAVDIDKQYFDPLKEIGKEWRRSWVRISFKILIEQKRHRLLYIYIYIYRERERERERERGREDRLCGLVVRVSGYRNRGRGFDPRLYQIF